MFVRATLCLCLSMSGVAIIIVHMLRKKEGLAFYCTLEI